MKIKHRFIGFSLIMIGLIGLLAGIMYWSSHQYEFGLKQLKIRSVLLERVQTERVISDYIGQLEKARRDARRLHRFNQLVSVSILMVSLVLSAVFLYLVNHDFIYKLDRLSMGINRLNQGDLVESNLDYPPVLGDSGNEIDNLASALDKVLGSFKQDIREKNGLLNLLYQSNEQLKQKQREMKKYQRELETKLKEKTLAWEQANHELRVHEIKLRAGQQEIKQLTRIDSLTGLYNRRELMKQLEREMDGAKRYQRPLSVMMLDADCFRHYNDVYGQREGDRLLAKIGKLIQVAIRKVDAGFRYGGDEFVVVLPDTPQDKAVVLADRLRQEVEKSVFNPRREDGKVDIVRTTISIGIAQYSPQDSINSLLKKADEAMRVVKRNGGGGVHIYDAGILPASRRTAVAVRHHSA
jgi:diguanylate cyclase (GGDEF)-like protein